MSLSIRAARSGDIAAIARIYTHAVLHGTASFEIEPPDETEMARRQHALVAGGHPYLVAEWEGAVLGYAYAGPYRARPAYRWSVEDSVYIAPDAQRRGIGRRAPVFGSTARYVLKHSPCRVLVTAPRIAA